MNLSRNMFHYGLPEPLAAQRTLCAGELTLALEGGDLRYLRWGEHEILRRVYVAVRDHNWGTIPPSFSDWQLDVQHDSFHVTFNAVHQQDTIDFFWRGDIRGDANGTISYEMDGMARSTFRRNRIGFCVLLPASVAGASARVEHADGTVETARLPIQVSPDQPVLPFANLRAVAYQVAPDVWTKVAFDGEIFEMEDQRNWTDASYKIFGTPLSLPFPVTIEKGTRIRQALTIALENPSARRATTRTESAEIIVELGTRTMPLPDIGVCVASHGEPLTAKELERLKRLKLAHLRVDLALDAADWRATLSTATAQSNELGVPLEIALPLTDSPLDSLQELRVALEELRPTVKRWLIAPQPERYKGGAPFPKLLADARTTLAAYAPNALVCGGTNADFIFLARNLSALHAADALFFSINPQAHATDHRSVVETLSAQASVIETARTLAQGRPIFVSPITFKPRFNAYATTPTPPTPPGELPPPVDARQLSLFGAGWTAASLKYAAQGGAAGITYFETTGWRGLIETPNGSPVPNKFPSQPGQLFPLYYVFRGVGEMRGGNVLKTQSSDPLTVEVLALERDWRRIILIGNLTSDTQRVRLAPFKALHATLRRLNEQTAEMAIDDEQAFDASAQPLTHIQIGKLMLDLLPFEVAQIEIQG
ncbi:MAG TPA: hypothetical protein VFD70_07890 [Anaerolineae bacterium]|nr:hypothetical protein [Anaerolineae bacterium]